MDNRSPLSALRPQAPQRAVSGSALHHHKLEGRPSIPSRLSAVRSVSQPANVVDLTADGADGHETNAAAFLGNQADVITSPDVIEVEGEDDGGGPPAKKAKTNGTGFRAETIVEEREEDAAFLTAPGDPLPAPPRLGSSTKAARIRCRGEQPARKANGVEPPTMATRLPPPKNVADFSPWTGNHPEDVMNETAVKVGYSDKGPGANQTESNSAKVTIWPNLSQKNNMGLQTLGYLFAQVMEKRQTMGKCTAPSTFKPPPRVTVTDTKREAWLRDLANPEIPLRKQSRTIPHGIRGKLLMDQCLSKNISLQRAVWLAKCVGANELRAFRRKGVSGAAAATGESKWVREWTVHVEQFLEGVIASCGQPEWKEKMNYAAKLAAALYTEKLVETEHYLDWIATSFAEATMERLPIWTLMVQIYWKDTTCFIRRGRSLAESILQHLHNLKQDRSDTNGMLEIQLERLLAVLAVTRGGCLVIPHTWDKYKYLLTATSTERPAINEPAMKGITKRNEHLISPDRNTLGSTRSRLLDLYDQLDLIGLDLDVDKLTAKISSIVPDSSELVPALLDWASSPYRQGIARSYHAARLISALRKSGFDTDSAVLKSLPTTTNTTSHQLEGTHKIIAELVRVESFSVGRYMQWLITSGALSNPQDSTRAAGLLAALPCYTVPIHLQNTKNSLLRRLGAAVELHDPADRVIAALEIALQQSSAGTMLPMGPSEKMDLSNKTIVGEHIRSIIRNHAAQSSMDLSRFCLLRSCLENIEDVPCLAELVSISLDAEDASLLSTVIDTINTHAESLAALAQFTALCNRATEQYRHLRSQQPLDRTLILALSSLARRLDRNAPLIELLTNDLAICEQQISLVVCSPASDNLVGMHASSLDSDHDIDAVFASGNVMDELLLQRVFDRVVQRAITTCGIEPGPVSKPSTWFNQLRIVGGSGFDQLAHGYIRSCFKDSNSGIAATGAITALVGSGCIGLDVVATAAREASTPSAALGALRLLSNPHAANQDLSVMEQYRYRVVQSSFCSSHLPILADLLCRATESTVFDPEDVAMGDLLISLSTRSPGTIKKSVEAGRRTQTSLANAAKVARALLRRGMPATLTDRELDPKTMIDLAGPLSVRFCACALESTVRAGGFQGSDTDGVMLELMIDAITGGNTVWPVLLGAVNLSTKRALHDWAQNQLLHTTTRVYSSEESAVRDVTSRYRAVLDATYEWVKDNDDFAIIATLAERLKDYASQLEGEGNDSGPTFPAENWSRSLVLDVLLHLCVLHVQTPPAETDVAKQSRGNLLLALCSLLDISQLQVQGDLSDHIFDLASTLADRLSPTTLSTLARSSAAGKYSNPQVRSILGDASNASETWLALASQIQPTGTQQQRALNKHASQQTQQQQQRQPSAGGHTGFVGLAIPMSQANTSSPQQTQQQQRSVPRATHETKTTPYPLRTWEIMPDPTPVMGENDTSLSLRLFGARKV